MNRLTIKKIIVVSLSLSIVFITATALLFGNPVKAIDVTWNPLVQQTQESDTLFIPNFTSLSTIEAGGGFLFGNHDKTNLDNLPNFDFGAGKFTPAIGCKTGITNINFVNYPVEGLLSSDEFTIEFWVKSDASWSGVGGSLLEIWGSNTIKMYVSQGNLIAILEGYSNISSKKASQSWSQSLNSLGITQTGTWYSIAMTHKNGTSNFYVGGVSLGNRTGLTLSKYWTNDVHCAGVMIGGAPNSISGLWVSDMRFSSTARVPNQAVTLKTLDSSITIDASGTAGNVPNTIFGALHPGGSSSSTEVSDAIQVVRTDKLINVTPIKSGGTDSTHPILGHSGRFSYDWQVVARSMAWFTDRGIKPFISVDSCPQILGGGSPPYSGTQLTTDLSCVAGFNIQKPNSWTDWQDIVADLVYYITNTLNVDVFAWGVWNEPDGMWNGTQQDYFTLYKYTVQGIRSIDSTAVVGGPSVASFNSGWINGLFDYCYSNSLPLNFIEYHDYSGDYSKVEEARSLVDSKAASVGYTTPFPVFVGEFNWSAEALYLAGVARWSSQMRHITSFGAAYTTAFYNRALEVGGIPTVIYSHVSYGDPLSGGWASTQLIGPNNEHWSTYNTMKGMKQNTYDKIASVTKNLVPGVVTMQTKDSATGKIGLSMSNWGYAQRSSRNVNLTVNNAGTGTWKMYRYLVDATHSSRWDSGASQNDLQLVETRDIVVTSGQPLNAQIILPSWSGTFITLVPPGTQPTPTPSPTPTPTPTPTPGGTIINDDNAGITYGSGTWSNYDNRGLGDYQNDVHCVNTEGYYFEYTFVGTGVEFITEKYHDMGNVEVFVDNVSQGTINCYNPTRLVQQTVFSKTGMASGTHTIKVVNRQNTKYIVMDALKIFNTAIINDDNAGITYGSGTWSNYDSRGLGDYQNDVHCVNTEGYYFEYSFVGTGVEFITEKYHDMGNVEVFVDNVSQGTINCYNPTRLVQQTVFSKTGMASGTHTIRVVNKQNGMYIVMDALKIYS